MPKNKYEKGFLYVHAFDGRKPGRNLRATIHSGYLFLLEAAAHVRIEDLTFCGSAYKDPRYSSWAIAIRCTGTSDITVDRCRFYYNSGGVAFTVRSKNSTVRNSFFHRNDAPGYAEAAQLFFGGASRNNLAENNIVVNTGVHGVRFYSGAIDDTARNNIIINSRIGLYYKATAGKRLAQGNVVLDSTSFNYSDLQGGRPIRDISNTFGYPSDVFDPNATNLLLKRNQKVEFCAPEYLDYRLQQGSSALGRGAFPQWDKVFYLSLSGNDKNSGGNEKTPFRTFERALKALQKGGTLYIAPGNYGSFKGNPENIVIRGRGRVFLEHLDLAGAKNVTVEGMKIKKADLKKSASVTLKKCFAHTISAGSETKIFSCSYENLSGSAKVYDSCCKNLPQGSFPESPLLPGVRESAAAEPEAPETPVFTFYGSTAAVSWVTAGVSADYYRVKNSWWSPRPCTSYLEYGETPEMGKRAYSSGNIFHNVELKNLIPGKTYYCRAVIPAHPFAKTNNGSWGKANFSGVEKSGSRDIFGKVATFTLPAPQERKSCEYFVSPAGSDENAGSVNAPFRSIAKAAQKALPGDTVTLLPGIYYDTITPLHSGTTSKPITFRASKAGSVILDGANFMRPGGIVCKNLSHIKFQGFILRNFANKLYANRAGANFGMAQLFDASDIEIRDCVFSAVGTYQHPVVLLNSSKVKLENCVFAKGVTAIDGSFNGDIAVKGCTFYVSEIHNIALSRQRPGSTVTVRNNLFTALTPQKALNRVDRTSITGNDFKVDFDENCWYFSPKDKYRYCGGEGGKIKLDPPAGVKRFHARTTWGKNDIEITSITFRGHKFTDPFEKEFGNIIKNLSSGKITPTLEFFESALSNKYGAKAVK